MFIGKLKFLLSITIILGLLGLVLGIAPAMADDGAGRKIKSKVPPLYPELAKRMNLSGVVKVEIIITPAGLVKNTKVVGGHPLLVDPAVDAVKKWKYEPAGEETTQVVEFHFNNSR